MILGHLKSIKSGEFLTGFSLIEVLIALLILSVGLLGFALLQTMSVRFAQAANYRTIATNLSYELFDEMRANRVERNNFPMYTSFKSGSLGSQQSECTPIVGKKMSVQDVATLWKCHVIHALGDQSSATVTYQKGIATITLQWPERTGEDASAFAVSTAL